MLATTLLLLGTAFELSDVAQAVSCRPSALQFGTKCYCLTSSVTAECSYTQDCSYANGCECNRAECRCGSGYCKDVGLCNTSTNKCRCSFGQFCLPEETCFLDLCVCDRETAKICKNGSTCKNKQCYCGDNICGPLEVCKSVPSPYCACGNSTSPCKANEVCEFDGSNYSCKCGGKVCGNEEKCEHENGSYSCKCGGNVCDDHELCIRPYPNEPPFCICGRKECAVNEKCAIIGTEKLCLCGSCVCQAPGTCQLNGTCMESSPSTAIATCATATSTATTTCATATSTAIPETIKTSDCMYGDVLFGSYCYHFSTEKTGHYDADRKCGRYTKYMLFILSAAEQEFIDNHMRGSPYWLCLVRFSNGYEGNFTVSYEWINGGPAYAANYTNWDDDYPINRMTGTYIDNNRCVIGGTGALGNKWRNVDCYNESISYVCKYEEHGLYSRDCRSGDVKFKDWGHCYHVGTEPRTFSKAQEMCVEEYHGNLVSILSEWDQRILDYSVFWSGHPYWTGLLRRHVSVGSSSANEYKWLGSLINASTVYTNWDRGYPMDNVSSFDCVATRLKPAGRWRNIDCNSKLAYICQY